MTSSSTNRSNGFFARLGVGAEPFRPARGAVSARSVFVAAAVIFGGVFVARILDDRVATGVALFYAVPVALLAFRFGMRGGIAGAAIATLLYVGWSILAAGEVPVAVYVSRPLTFFILGGLVGYLSQMLAASEARFEMALTHAPVLVFNADREARYTWIHHSWSGRVDVPMIGLTDIDLLPSGEGQRPYDIKRRAIETGEPMQGEFVAHDPDGNSRWFSTAVEPVRDAAGRVTGLTGATLDITGERRAVEAVAESERRFRTAVENLLEPFALYAAIRDADGRIVDFRVEFINTPAAESVGMPSSEMIGKRISELFPGRLELRLVDEYAAVVETGRPYFRETVDFINVLGEETLVRAFDIRVSRLDDGVEVSWRDITDRIRAEQDRDRLVAIVESAVDAIVSVGLDGRIKSWSGGATRLYGYTADEAIGMHFSDLFPEHSKPERAARLNRVMKGEAIGPVEAIELRKDGSEVRVSYTAAPIRGRGGQLIGAARIIRELPDSQPFQLYEDAESQHTSVSDE